MKNEKQSLTRYLRLLSYENGLKVIDFICKNDEDDYANITVGGVCTQVKDENWEKILNYINGLNVRYEVTLEHPTKVVEQIVSGLKAMGVIEDKQKEYSEPEDNNNVNYKDYTNSVSYSKYRASEYIKLLKQKKLNNKGI